MNEEMANEIRTLVEEIETRIARIKDMVEESEPSKQADTYTNRLKILGEVSRKGGVVSKEQWKEIGEKYGMDTRGLGGFFVGEGSMVRIGDDKRALTEKGARLAKMWLEKQE